MQTVFVSIKCELGAAYRVAELLVDTVEGVAGVYSTSGPFDLLAQCNLESSVDVGLYVTEVVQRVRGVKDTLTVIAYNAFTPARLPATVRPAIADGD